MNVVAWCVLAPWFTECLLKCPLQHQPEEGEVEEVTTRRVLPRQSLFSAMHLLPQKGGSSFSPRFVPFDISVHTNYVYKTNYYTILHVTRASDFFHHLPFNLIFFIYLRTFILLQCILSRKGSSFSTMTFLFIPDAVNPTHIQYSTSGWWLIFLIVIFSVGNIYIYPFEPLMTMWPRKTYDRNQKARQKKNPRKESFNKLLGNRTAHTHISLYVYLAEIQVLWLLLQYRPFKKNFNRLLYLLMLLS